MYRLTKCTMVMERAVSVELGGLYSVSTQVLLTYHHEVMVYIYAQALYQLLAITNRVETSDWFIKKPIITVFIRLRIRHAQYIYI